MNSDPDAAVSRYVRQTDILDANLSDDETVLLSPASGNYYGLEGPGAAIWNALESPRTIGEVCDLLMQEFDVERAQCEDETAALIEHLVRKGLVSQLGG